MGHAFAIGQSLIVEIKVSYYRSRSNLYPSQGNQETRILAPSHKSKQERALYPHGFRQGTYFPSSFAARSQNTVLTKQWVDEDEQDGDAADPLGQFNFGNGGMPDMGDLDFSKLGGNDFGAGAGGLQESSDDEDMPDDMPELESDTKEVEGKGKEPASSA